MDEVRILPEQIDPNILLSFVRDSSAGAISTFLGTTRDNFEGFICSSLNLIFLDKQVISLEYEAYPEMAVLEMRKICQKVRA